MMQLLWLLTLAIVSGCAYHLGGLGADGAKHYPRLPAWVFSRWIRPTGCTMCALIYVVLCIKWSDLLVLSSILMYAAVTCYWNFLRPQAGKKWWNWALHGLGIGLSLLPYGIAIGHICSVGVYAIALATTFTIWSENISIAWLEECGRGALIIILLFLLHY